MTSRQRIAVALIATAGLSIGLATPAVGSTAGSGSSVMPLKYHVVNTICNGEPITVTIPESTVVDPKTVTAAQLDAYGLPPRPDNPADLAIWARAVSGGLKWQVPQCRKGRATPTKVSASADPPSSNYVGTGVHNAAWMDAEAEWHVPLDSTSTGTGTYVSSTWVGVNLGSTAHPLIQAGSENDNTSPSHPSEYLWWEAWPDNYQQTLYAYGTRITNDLIFVHVHYSGNSAGYHVEDLSNGYATRFSKTINGSIDGHAEFITERTAINCSSPTNCTLPYLTNYRSVAFTSAQAATSAGWKSVGAASHYNYTMVDNVGTTMATPTGPSGFTCGSNWRNEGHYQRY